mgnify:CR=1 FL=1
MIRDGVGATSMGRGGANIACGDNAAVILDNPAGMLGVDGEGLFELSLDGLLLDLSYADPFTADHAAARPLGLPEIGIIRRSAEGTWAWGVGVVAPAGFGANFDLEDPVFGRQVYSSFGALAKILPAAACQLTERLSLGATLGMGISQAAFAGPFHLQTGPLRGAPTIVDVRATGASLVWSVGAQYQLTEATTLGLAYQSESRFQLDGNATVDILGLGPAPVTSDFDAQLDLAWPQSLGVGIAHEFACQHRIAADAVWINWAGAFDNMGIHLGDSSNPLVSQLLAPTLSDQLPFDWRNSVSFRLGYEFFVTPSVVLRAGYVHNLNQVPDGTLTPYIPAIVEHALSLGWGFRGDWCDLDVAYQLAFGPDRSVEASDLAGGDFDGAEYNARAYWLAIALRRRF